MPLTPPKPNKPLPVIYVSGPMSGHEDHNFPAFNGAARDLRALGFPVLNPADFGASPKYTWAECLKRDIAALGHAEVIVLLPGYRASKGATLELTVAGDLGIEEFEIDSPAFGAFLSSFFDRAELSRFIRASEAVDQITVVFLPPVLDDDDEDGGASPAPVASPRQPGPPPANAVAKYLRKPDADDLVTPSMNGPFAPKPGPMDGYPWAFPLSPMHYQRSFGYRGHENFDPSLN